MDKKEFRVTTEEITESAVQISTQRCWIKRAVESILALALLERIVDLWPIRMTPERGAFTMIATVPLNNAIFRLMAAIIDKLGRWVAKTVGWRFNI
ncbi:hypothetical protein GWI33_003198 [Rhynchophorus ferrugineus]|uniref:Uncharacterized protein n=1 Tax=Rhynchophorus ferrugineus TaxID=354439 RepID=A0A834J2Z4_RHYFE|nr:hypothetical protein GWI33_003198 [Rhynchophorus ferrugineus]